MSLPLTGQRILVVDDEADSRDVIAFILQQAGAEVTAVSSARKALQILQTTKLDLLLSDIGMPQMNGYDLMRQICQIPTQQSKGVPATTKPACLRAIALTAYAGEDARAWALEAGFQHYISKPLEPERLIQVVLQVLENSHC